MVREALKVVIIYLVLIQSCYFYSCSTRVNDPDDNNVEKPLVGRVGSSSSFEIATWNIENFPLNGTSTITNLGRMISDLDIDIIGVQEVADVSAFNLMISNLPEWRSVLSDDEYSPGSYQKTGIIYRFSQVSLSNKQNIFTDDSYAFPRPPLTAYMQVRDGSGVKFDFNLIVLHLKAYSDPAAIERRKQACEKLEGFIRDQIDAGADPDFIVLGDWNDQLELNDQRDVFTPFLSRQDMYRFLTLPLTNGYSYIFTPYQNVIDHILITADAEDEYGVAGETRILELEKQYSSYTNTISDHRPVAAIFKAFSLE
ncbi:MAG: endonuclease/exonuclease/phosphatase family protein [Calditrichaceae bacterium]|nr:endonuclease/exonuclease/phosphatase family protein [Calditrichaceae bacterium]MBN2707894.1 endonuclease/exonuclease/phosphatase family protein [Calditrichaceae bacterium]RQV97841.1 MAG: hypothetical protein EH224_00095 [Calditrichota bacterium]